MSDFRNGSGYFDPTAFQALRNIEEGAKKMNFNTTQGVYRGDIFYIANKYQTTGSEQKAGRPAIIVSNDVGNACSEIVQVVYLTTQEKKPLPTHVEVMCNVPSTALCEQIHTVSKERLENFVRICTEEEMKQIDKAILISLEIEPEVKVEKHVEYVEVAKEPEQQQGINEQVIRLEIERDMYKHQAEKLFDRLLER